MRFVVSGAHRRRGSRLAIWWLAVVATCAAVACRTASSPGAPGGAFEGESPSYVGVWSGTIASIAGGPGTIELRFDSQRNTPGSPLVTGRGSVSFTDPRFSVTTGVVGAVTPDGVFGVTFDRHVVPCPDEPGGVSERGMFASLTVTGNRMRGSYIAGSCPGGTIELTRQ